MHENKEAQDKQRERESEKQRQRGRSIVGVRKDERP